MAVRMVNSIKEVRFLEKTVRARRSIRITESGLQEPAHYEALVHVVNHMETPL
jgi:hypothetical protein